MQLEVLKLAFEQYTIVLEDDHNYSVNSADNTRSYSQHHQLTDGGYQFSSKHSVSLFRDNEPVNSCIVLAEGGASGIHPHSAAIHRECCFIAVGPMIGCLKLPTLDLVWKTKVDLATCFGIHHSVKHSCLISHGECDIARLDYDGKIVWSHGGKDIFTEGFSISEDFVTATDFNWERYRFDIGTGRGGIF
ncbi:MAG: hypothetical protein JF609_04355 [Verrucomicrobia bacterium]|nr:hypothetical protein [Verrucomicrobiota bacterium]